MSANKRSVATRSEVERYLEGRMPAKLLAMLKKESDYDFDQLWAEAIHRRKNGERVPFFSDVLDEILGQEKRK